MTGGRAKSFRVVATHGTSKTAALLLAWEMLLLAGLVELRSMLFSVLARITRRRTGSFGCG